MEKLKLGPLADEKPVKVTVELPAVLYSDLAAYAELLAVGTGIQAGEPAKLIAPMLARFMATDRFFCRQRRRKTSNPSRLSKSPETDERATSS